MEIYIFPKTKQKTLNIISWNKGNGNIENKFHIIQDILNISHPHILLLNEFNLKNEDCEKMYTPHGYTLELDSNRLKNGFTRNSAYISNQLVYRRRNDLESPLNPVIWLQLGLPNQKKILLQSMYRQWQEPGASATKSISEQKKRFESIIQHWEKALAEKKEILTIGDFNLNSEVWDKPLNEWSGYQRSHLSMIWMLQIKILSRDTIKIPTPPTREGYGAMTTLDHIYATHPQKIRTDIDHNTTSDHSALLIQRYVKSIPQVTQYRTFRDFRDTNKMKAKAEILTHPLYEITKTLTDPNQIAQNLQLILNTVLDDNAPIKLKQINRKQPRYIKKETKELIIERDEAQHRAMTTKHNDDIRKHQHLKKQLYHDNKDYNNLQFTKAEGNPNNQYKVAREKLGWNTTTPPNRIISEGTMKVKPKEIARSMNLDYIKRNNDLATSINDNGIDPLQHYKKSIKKPKNQLELVTVTMHDLKMTQKNMKSTPSTGYDTISTKTLKEYQDVLLPLLLNLVNQTITTNTYPKTLKTAKIIPLKKPSKTH